MDPPPDAQKQVWAAVLANLPAAAGAAGAATAAAKGAAKVAATAAAKGGGASAGAAIAGAGILKSVLIGAGSAMAVLATYSAVAPPDKADLSPVHPPAIVASASPRPTGPAGHRRAADKPQDPAADPTPAAIPEQRAPADARPAAHAPAAPAGGDPQGAGASNPGGPGPAAPGALPAGGGDPHAPVAAAATTESPAGAPPEMAARAEARLVGEVRDALQRGDAAGALAQLGRIDERFPGGVLGQEREALAIEALARSGRRAEAAARAAAFLEAHPQSMLAGRVQPFAAPATPR
jgi:hypothetical protein